MTFLFFALVLAQSNLSVSPSYQGKIYLPVNLWTVKGTLLEKGSYLVKIKKHESGNHVLVFFSGGQSRAQVVESAGENLDFESAEIPLVGTHYLVSTAEPIAPAEERRRSKTGMPRYQEESRDWKAALRVYQAQLEGDVFFIYFERQEHGKWKKTYFRLLSR